MPIYWHLGNDSLPSLLLDLSPGIYSQSKLSLYLQLQLQLQPQFVTQRLKLTQADSGSRIEAI